MTAWVKCKTHLWEGPLQCPRCKMEQLTRVDGKQERQRMDVYDVMPEVVGPRPVGHLLGPDLRTGLCGVKLGVKGKKPVLLDEEQRKMAAVCHGCKEIMALIKQARRARKCRHDDAGWE
jgi:hypothetical protein